MHSHPWRSGGWFARHQAACSRCRHLRAICRSRATECAARERELFPGGRPSTTVLQRRVPARACRMWRLQYAISRALARVLAPDVVLVVAVVVVFDAAVVEPVPLLLEPTAAAAAVVMPANASSSPQANIERRNS